MIWEEEEDQEEADQEEVSAAEGVSPAVPVHQAVFQADPAAVHQEEEVPLAAVQVLIKTTVAVAAHPIHRRQDPFLFQGHQRQS